ncbi:DUF2357 domain-containing protein [Marinobacter sp.]|uniref:DUF2357 domain-containing protein n=1 Tax=Marinobacter sp. TaxID=50741 RepID=UPI003A8ECD16
MDTLALSNEFGEFMKIFSDRDLSEEVHNIIYENKTYFVELPNFSTEYIDRELRRSGIESFIKWHKRNRIATLRVENKIGIFKIFDLTFDVRSAKFLESHSGKRQFEFLLDDLRSLSRDLVFTNRDSTGAYRKAERGSTKPNILERFNYLRHSCLGSGKLSRLESIINTITKNPKFSIIQEHKKDLIWKARSLSAESAKSILKFQNSAVILPSVHPLSEGKPGLKVKGTQNSIFPTKILQSYSVISYDTPENRFVKFILRDIEDVCRRIITKKLLKGHLYNECDNLLKRTRSLLQRPFFQGLDTPNYIPSSSPTILKRPGYRELYQLFIKSRTSSKHIFSDIENTSYLMELKDISTLYEYWCFYKVCTLVLDRKCFLELKESIVKEGRILNSAVVSDGIRRVYFNRTFSKNKETSYSYSVPFRPDIVIEKNDNKSGVVENYILDAKYKSIDLDKAEESLDETTTIRTSKRIDLYKMHCYFDAIENVKSAVSIFPGNQFRFYQKHLNVKALKEAIFYENLEGVGSVPLLPGAVNSDFEKYLSDRPSSRNCHNNIDVK